jgi:hypothetical protein
MALTGDGILSVVKGISALDRPRYSTAASTTSLTPDADLYSFYTITALAGGLTINNPTSALGYRCEGQKLMIRIKDDGTARAIAFGSEYRAMGTSLPTTTTVNKTMYLGFIFNTTDTKWDLLSLAQEA